MRAFFLAMGIFIGSGVLLLSRVVPSFALEPALAAGALFLIMGLALLIQWDSAAVQKKILLLTQAVAEKTAVKPVAAVEPAPTPVVEAPPMPSRHEDAVTLLALLQDKGRFVDFIKEDISAFPDAQVGAAARVVHQGCGQVLRDFFTITPVTASAEGSTVEVVSSTPPGEYRLLGNFSGEAPYRGSLVHRGWRADRVELPQTLSASRILAPAEIEVH